MPVISALHRVVLGAVLFATPSLARAQAPALGAGTAPVSVGQRHAHFTPVSRLADTGPMANAAAGLARQYGGTPIDVLSFHYDNARTGWNPNETDLTAASVASSGFGLLTTLNVDGNVFAQPLLATAIRMADGSLHDVLIVATGHDTVYAYDAQSYAVLWQVSLGQAQSSNDVNCQDVQPEYGISGTPVILRKAAGVATLYVVAATEPSKNVFHTELHALNLGTGADAVPPVEIAPSATLSDGSTLSFDAKNQWSRTGLATRNGSIYVGIGSHCDNNAGGISGWLLRYDGQLVQHAAFHTIETPHGGSELASIWMSGFAPALDADGNVFAVTGNGDMSARGMDWGESVLRLPRTLARVGARFTPSAYGTLNGQDTDFGSGGVMLVPPVAGQTVPPLAVAIGKSGVLYLLDQSRLGGLKPDDTGTLQATQIGVGVQGGVWGGPAYYDGPAGPLVYVQVDRAPLVAYAVATTGTPALTKAAQGSTQGGYGGSMPVVSSNGATAGSAVVWTIRRSSPIEIEAYDADSLGTPLFSANAGVWSNQHQNSFLTAMVANGRVYAPAYKTVKVFGLQ